MPRQELTLASLKDFDFGKVDVAFRQHLKRAVADCLDRPGDGADRKVELTFVVTPERNQEGDCDRVGVYCKVLSKVPAHRSATFQCQPSAGGNLSFDDLSPESTDQATMDYENGGQHAG